MLDEIDMYTTESDAMGNFISGGIGTGQNSTLDL